MSAAINHPTAILLFSRSAEAEARSKPFGAGRDGDVRIAHALIQRTERTLARAEMPVIKLDETRQRGSTFGERLSHAMDDAFALGYEHLLVVGNDAPDLRVGLLRKAAATLAAGHNVLIPDHRGGIVLLGISAAAHRTTNLSQLAWETDRLYDELSRSLSNLWSGAAIIDVNGITDLRTIWFRVRAIFGALYSLVFHLISFSIDRSSTVRRMWGKATLRGPPTAVYN